MTCDPVHRGVMFVGGLPHAQVAGMRAPQLPITFFWDGARHPQLASLATTPVSTISGLAFDTRRNAAIAASAPDPTLTVTTVSPPCTRRCSSARHTHAGVHTVGKVGCPLNLANPRMARIAAWKKEEAAAAQRDVTLPDRLPVVEASDLSTYPDEKLRPLLDAVRLELRVNRAEGDMQIRVVLTDDMVGAVGHAFDQAWFVRDDVPGHGPACSPSSACSLVATIRTFRREFRGQ